MRPMLIAAVVTASSGATGAAAQTKWDIPTGYAPNNFHTINVQKFSDGVTAATAGKLVINLVINLPSNASLFKALGYRQIS